MTRRRVLVAHTRMPAFDRDRGSQEIDNSIRFLLDAGWQVTFLAREGQGVAEERHAQRLRNLGVATYAGFDWAERLLRSNSFDLALVAFWELGEVLIPLIHEHSPDTRVVINSIDVHFLRLARRALVQGTQLDATYGDATARELNTYSSADAVIAVSERECSLLGDFLGEDRVFAIPLSEQVERSTVPRADRRGMLFVANFRHEPNKEAIEYLCAEVLPLMDRTLLTQHPLRVIGNRLAEARLDIDERTPGVQLIGWVPEITPYLEQSRISVVPLLHGAGVKGKVLQSMMAYTPVVTTPVGAEGLEIVNGVHALVATDAADLAAGITRLLVDDDLWTRVAEAGADHMDARHSLELVRTRFTDVVAHVMQRPARTQGGNRGGMTVAASDGRADAIRRRVQMIAAPGAVVLVATAGESIELSGQRGVAFVEPPDGPAGIVRLEAQREQGAAYLVLPKPAFAWRHTLPELHHHLEETARRVHQDEHMIVYDLASRDADPVLGTADTGPRRVHVLGTYAPDRTGPAGAIVAELANSRHDVHQTWRSATEPPPAPDTSDFPDPDYLVYVRDDAILPSRFLDDLVATQAHLDADRAQPTHISGPASGPPIIERHKGVIAREVLRATPLPVLSVRAGADPVGPVALLDFVNVGLRSPVHATEDAIDAFSHVCTVWVRGADGSIVRYDRPEPDGVPRISVVMATYERGDLLRESLLAFSKQTLNRSEYEVVLVDDGSRDSSLDAMLDEFAEQLQVTGVRIAHAGRSAAKNMAILLARAPVVLIFDDDDRPASDYLERHVRAHDARPEPGVAILGHTDWAPEVEPTEVMHFVTDVDRLMFAYERLRHGQELDWRGFWEGRISCKRAHLVRHALHDQRINYSIDVEMGWRLAPHGLRVIYDTTAVSVMARPLDTETFCTRIQAKGRAHAAIAALHPGTDIARQFKIDAALELWEKDRSREGELRRRVASLEARAGRDEREGADARDQKVISELHVAYRQLFKLLHAKGVAEATGRLDRERVVAEPARRGPARGTPAITPKRPRPPTTVPRVDRSPPEFAYDGSPVGASAAPALSISIPVWSRSPELAAMAVQTIDRIWEVARVPTEVVVVDNGSPYETRLAAKVYRYPENTGVSAGWNTGIRLSGADAFVVLNSDCMVEPGWDEALYEAATDGRRIAFPYTDHDDGNGFTMPDQAGTAGWCFMMTRAVHDEIGDFDEWFSPAFGEDTDYWHRAWQLGIELTPVPAARVVHARRTTGGKDSQSEWLLLAHRYKYGWKHDVEPLRAPPYYKREIIEYHGSFELRGDER